MSGFDPTSATSTPSRTASWRTSAPTVPSPNDSPTMMARASPRAATIGGMRFEPFLRRMVRDRDECLLLLRLERKRIAWGDAVPDRSHGRLRLEQLVGDVERARDDERCVLEAERELRRPSRLRVVHGDDDGETRTREETDLFALQQVRVDQIGAVRDRHVGEQMEASGAPRRELRGVERVLRCGECRAFRAIEHGERDVVTARAEVTREIENDALGAASMQVRDDLDDRESRIESDIERRKADGSHVVGEIAREDAGARLEEHAVDPRVERGGQRAARRREEASPRRIALGRSEERDGTSLLRSAVGDAAPPPGRPLRARTTSRRLRSATSSLRPRVARARAMCAPRARARRRRTRRPRCSLQSSSSSLGATGGAGAVSSSFSSLFRSG